MIFRDYLTLVGLIAEISCSFFSSSGRSEVVRGQKGREPLSALPATRYCYCCPRARVIIRQEPRTQSVWFHYDHYYDYDFTSFFFFKKKCTVQIQILTRTKHVKLGYNLLAKQNYLNKILEICFFKVNIILWKCLTVTLCPFPSLKCLKLTGLHLPVAPARNASACKCQHSRRSTVVGYVDHETCCYSSRFVL